MSDDIINQTDFTEGTHPVEPSPVVPTMQIQPAPKKKSMLPIIGAIVALVVLILGSVSYVSYTKRNVNVVSATPTPMPTGIPIETQGIRAEIAPYFQIIEDSNPEKDEHPFPPVNFDTRIKDPNIR